MPRFYTSIGRGIPSKVIKYFSAQAPGEKIAC
jgi:hypothetical protein